MEATGRPSRLLAAVLGLFVVVPVLAACQPGPSCGGNQRPYNNTCLDNVAITYIECTKGHGYDLTTELGGKLGGTFKVIADASVEAAYKTTQEENTAVSLQIVSDCLRIAEAGADRAEDKSAAEQSRARADQIRQQVAETAHIDVNPSQARIGASVLVNGRNFYPEETVALYVHATLVTQIQADGNGAFSATVTVPTNAPPFGFPTFITAAGETSSKTAQAPFEAMP